jgi:hypothetical protein
MERLTAGQKIEHNQLPGFVMDIEETAECETDLVRHEPHARYQITDPEGNKDWLCAYDVHEVTS